MMQFWGYRHTNGSVHTKRYFGPLDIQEAHESPFCEEVHGPFSAGSVEDARAIAFQVLKSDKPDEQINPPWLKASMSVEQAAKAASMRNCTLRAMFDRTMGVRIVAIRRTQ